MSIDEKLAIPFYRVGLERLTFTEILERFVDPSQKSGNFHRISDMHVKIGMPISFSTDDELVSKKVRRLVRGNVAYALYFTQ